MQNAMRMPQKNINTLKEIEISNKEDSLKIKMIKRKFQYMKQPPKFIKFLYKM